MQIRMKYGKNGLNLNLPDDTGIAHIQKRTMPFMMDPVAGVYHALSHPVASKKLIQEARGCHNACILICDITRPVPNGVILPVLIRELLKAGLSPSSITVIVATGLHRPNEGEELRELVGDDWVLNTVKIVNHFARNNDEHVDLGVTKDGMTIKIDRRFVRADLRIVTGLVEPHFMAGYSGGRKVVVPGIAHKDTITEFHTAKFLEHPKAMNCVLDGNPLHKEQIEIIRMLGRTLAINTIIDDKRRLSFVNFGEIEVSHLEAVSYLREYAEIRVPDKYKTVITCAGGYPLDKTYYQTIKGFVGAMDILAQGGNLMIFSECSEGIGSHEFVEAQKRLLSLGMDRFLESLLAKSHAGIDEWQTEMLLKPMNIGTLHLISKGLSDADHILTCVNVVKSPNEAVLKCIEEAGDNRVAVIPEGPYVVPIFSPYGGPPQDNSI